MTCVPTTRTLASAADVQAALLVGDPLAEALAGVLGEPGVARQLDAALHGGLDAVGEPHPAVAAYVGDLEATTRAADEELLERGSRPYFSVPFPAHVYDLGAGALIRSYAPPEPAAVLVSTGELVDRAYRRLLDTAHWVNVCMLPGGLRRGAPGYVATARVRLLHARIRRGLLHARPAGEVVALHQVDLARAWLDFSLVAAQAAETIGFSLTEREQRTLYRFWRHLGLLLGIGVPGDPGLLRGIEDSVGAAHLDRLIAEVTAAPSHDSRRLTAAGLGAIAQALHDLGGAPLPLATVLVHTVSRRMQGEELADALGIQRHPAALALAPVAVAALRAQHRLLRRWGWGWSVLQDVNYLVARWHARREREATGYEGSVGDAALGARRVSRSPRRTRR